MKLEQVMQCCAFSTRNNEMGHSSQLLGLADLDGVHARGVKGAKMGLDRTLECKNSGVNRTQGYQPRSWSRSASGSLLASIPGIASPKFLEALAISEAFSK